jgi:hypothetical protein
MKQSSKLNDDRYSSAERFARSALRAREFGDSADSKA